jgi:hypothetical protein
MAAEHTQGMLALTLLSRPDCPLCEEFATALMDWRANRSSITIDVVDIGSDAALEARYGWIIPVLLAGDRQLCSGHFDPGALRDLLP